MIGGDEMIFSGSYKDFKLGIRFDLAGKQPVDVAHALAHISSEIEPHAFRFSGIDTKSVDDFVTIKGKGISSVCNFLESNSSQWTKMIKKNLSESDPKLLPVAESYFFNRMLEKAGVPFKASPESSLEPENEEIGDHIAFIGKYKDWMAIKKLGLEDVKDYEVSGMLSGINHTVVNKAFDFAGVKKDDATVESIAKGKRKSYGNVLLGLQQLEPKLSGGPDDAYLVCKVLETLGYRPYASPGMLTDAHPDIKPPKVRGRKPKG